MALYDIENCWLCAASLRERGLNESSFIIESEILEPDLLRQRLDDYDVILRF
jgi:tRNA 2-thiouridine synthesizing protein C